MKKRGKKNEYGVMDKKVMLTFFYGQLDKMFMFFMDRKIN